MFVFFSWKWLALEVLLMAMETMITIDPAWRIFAGIKFWLNDEKTVCYTVRHIFIHFPLCGSLFSWNKHYKLVVFGFKSSGHWGLNYFWSSSMQLPNNWSVHFASFFRPSDSILSLISLYLASFFECVQIESGRLIKNSIFLIDCSKDIEFLVPNKVHLFLVWEMVPVIQRDLYKMMCKCHVCFKKSRPIYISLTSNLFELESLTKLCT